MIQNRFCILHSQKVKSSAEKKVILPTHGTCVIICAVTKERWFLSDRVRLKSYPPQLHQKSKSKMRSAASLFFLFPAMLMAL